MFSSRQAKQENQTRTGWAYLVRRLLAAGSYLAHGSRSALPPSPPSAVPLSLLPLQPWLPVLLPPPAVRLLLFGLLPSNLIPLDFAPVARTRTHHRANTQNGGQTKRHEKNVRQERSERLFLAVAVSTQIAGFGLYLQGFQWNLRQESANRREFELKPALDVRSESTRR